jgi:hypothetical protein
MISLSGHFGSAKDNRGVSIKMQVKAVYEIISENINRILVDDLTIKGAFIWSFRSLCIGTLEVYCIN